MNLNMFLVFPGVLITIGVALLLISIIIIVVAYKTADPKEEVFIQKPHEEEIEIKEIEEPQDLETTKVFKSASIQSGNEITSGANFEGSLNFLVFGKPRYSEIAHCLSEASLSNF